LAFPPAIFDPVEDIVAAPLLLFALNPFPRPPFLACPIPLLPVTVDPRPFLLVAVSPIPLLPVTIDPLPLLLVARGPFAQLSIPRGPFTFLLGTVDCGPVIPAPIASPVLGFRKTTDGAREISGAVGVLAVFPGGGLIAVGDTPPVTGGVMPAAGLCYPPVVPDKSWSLVHIDVNIVAVPIEIAPGAEGETEIKAGPV
jgi:hypothetical protein